MTGITVFSDFRFEGEVGGIMFTRLARLSMLEEIAYRAMILLGQGQVVLIQNLAGNAISGGPVPARFFVDMVSLGLVAEVTGETTEEVRRRLIVFATHPEEAEAGMPVIRLQDIKSEELRMSELELWSLGHEHPLIQIRELAIKANSRK